MQFGGFSDIYQRMGCVFCKAMHKSIPSDAVFAYKELELPWARGELEREASFMLGVALASQIETLTGKPMTDFKLPQGICVRALGRHETRHRRPDGTFVILDSENETPTEALNEIYSHRTHFVKTVEQSMLYQMDLARGNWKVELQAMARRGL